MPGVFIDQKALNDAIARLAALEKNHKILLESERLWTKEYGSGTWIAIWGGKVVFSDKDESKVRKWDMAQPEHKMLTTLIAKLGTADLKKKKRG